LHKGTKALAGGKSP